VEALRSVRTRIRYRCLFQPSLDPCNSGVSVLQAGYTVFHKCKVVCRGCERQYAICGDNGRLRVVTRAQNRKLAAGTPAGRTLAETAANNDDNLQTFSFDTLSYVDLQHFRAFISNSQHSIQPYNGHKSCHHGRGGTSPRHAVNSEPANSRTTNL
jgi:hypothetical protein